ncbi:hypothetical protein HD806DRAFT_205719 [Xylariaceae sp. AK1471]|nr:hypothetical protein HD806DRAFT_205719 [Xylariaceae sp. AK1471]
MFLHSGASLHGHEFSKRSTQAVANSPNRRNPLLRASFSTPTKRASTFPPEPPLSLDHDAVCNLKKPNAFFEPAAKSQDNVSVNCQEPRNDLLASQSEIMSEDETSIISDTETSRVSSLSRKRRSGTRTSTTYVLAHPPPKLRTKQRILHIRPNLVLQIQEVSPGLRPKPIIDVYPSSAIAGSIIAPLLKRFPRNSRIKGELSIHDIMLVRSEDYTSQPSGSESECDEDSIMARDLLAILSPSKTEDSAEIVMAEGSVWVATTRSSRNTFSYEFTSVDHMGKTITARWVRKQVISSSLPGTPTSPTPNTGKPQLPDSKFTFSMIDPNCRRHPILATLTSSSLSILDTYTTVSQSANRYPPTSQCFSPPNSPSRGDQTQAERRTRSVEEWQKSFISISAVWVALQYGWAPNFRPEDFIPSRTSVTSQVVKGGRQRSFSASANSSPTCPHFEATRRGKYPIEMRQLGLPSTNKVPRRATSTGAAFIERRRAMQQESDDQLTDSEQSRMIRLNRRALSGDWNVGLLKSMCENSLAESILSTPCVSLKDDSESRHIPALAPPPTPARRRVVSAYSPISPLQPDRDSFEAVEMNEASIDATRKSPEPGDVKEVSPRRRHHKWKSMVNWFRKLSER